MTGHDYLALALALLAANLGLWPLIYWLRRRDPHRDDE